MVNSWALAMTYNATMYAQKHQIHITYYQVGTLWKHVPTIAHNESLFT